MTLPEEVGKVATSTIDALKGSPIMLAILVMNILFLGFVYFGITKSREYQASEFGLVLNHCYPPPREKT